MRAGSVAGFKPAFFHQFGQIAGEKIARCDFLPEGEGGTIEFRRMLIDAAHKSFGRVVSNFPRTFERTSASGGVKGDFKPQPPAFANGVLNQLAPFRAHHLHFRFWGADMVVILPVSARVRHQTSSEAEIFHRFEIGGYALAIGIPVLPPPVAPGLGLTGRVGKIRN